MTPTVQMTIAQERKFYREAVQASLQSFYGKSPIDAKRLVRDWWKRLVESGVSDSGLFLHSEPINMAAGIAEAQVMQITKSNRETYHRLLNRSRDLVLATSSAKGRTRKLQGSVDKVPKERLVHFAAASTSSIVRNVASSKKGK